MNRIYMDWNATAPLRIEARDAMIAAMDAVGNPSSVHAEGRAAKAIIERARGQVATLLYRTVDEIIFTSGATEANATALAAYDDCEDYIISAFSHPSIIEWAQKKHEMEAVDLHLLKPSTDGNISVSSFEAVVNALVPQSAMVISTDGTVQNEITSRAKLYLTHADGETGTIHNFPDIFASEQINSCCVRHVDVTQTAGKIASLDLTSSGTYSVSSHKLGGAKGVGALIQRGEPSLPALIHGGGQELGRRSGTENLIGIAGFGAAAEAAARDLADGVWDQVAELRDYLEARIVEIAPEVIIFGKDVKRLPNTSNFAIPGWKGETQVMQMDLAGYAISAGSACSSGKVKVSRVLQAMGFDDVTASSAIRVSLGPTNTKDEIDGFVSAWGKSYKKFSQKAA